MVSTEDVPFWREVLMDGSCRSADARSGCGPAGRGAACDAAS
jgi:hypothetical protein